MNKKVCKKCSNKRGQKWTSFDDDLWKVKKVVCPKEVASFEEGIPESCPYFLENIVLKDSMDDV